MVAKTSAAMSAEQIKQLVIQALEDAKAQRIVSLDVRAMTDVADYLVVASGTSSRHVKSLAGKVVEQAKEQSLRPIGVEGEDRAEWVLVDFADVVVHLMQEDARAFYDLERLWSTPAARE